MKQRLKKMIPCLLLIPITFLVTVVFFQNCGEGFKSAGNLGSEDPTTPQGACKNKTMLTWDAPTTNTDGSPLTDLAGYKIYYGDSSGQYSSTVPVNAPSAV